MRGDLHFRNISCVANSFRLRVFVLLNCGLRLADERVGKFEARQNFLGGRIFYNSRADCSSGLHFARHDRNSNGDGISGQAFRAGRALVADCNAVLRSKFVDSFPRHVEFGRAEQFGVRDVFQHGTFGLAHVLLADVQTQASGFFDDRAFPLERFIFNLGDGGLAALPRETDFDEQRHRQQGANSHRLRTVADGLSRAQLDERLFRAFCEKNFGGHCRIFVGGSSLANDACLVRSHEIFRRRSFRVLEHVFNHQPAE